jgi:glucan phosphoethanolaminetransferase (alkaline phosphatase superfamily)
MPLKSSLINSSIFILAEIVIGALFGYLFIENYSGGNRSLNGSIIHFYSFLNLTFLIPVIKLGSINAIILKKKHKILIA